MGEQASRWWGAVRRYKWLALTIIAVGTSAGYALTRLVPPKYEVNATIWIARAPSGTGPITAPGLLTDALSWTELAESFIVLDQVVAALSLHVSPAVAADTVALRSLRPSPALQPGSYALEVEGSRYTLTRRSARRGETDAVMERGDVGDSIGTSVGFLWQPAPELLRSPRNIVFEVVTPREASLRLDRRLNVSLAPQSNMMRLYLSGDQPELLARTLNTLQTIFVDEAARLKRENLSAVALTVEDQLQRAQDQLQRASASYENFKVNTITLPSENTPVAPGIQLATNPVFSAFFQDKVSHQTVVRDREALERIMNAAATRGGRISIEALRALPPVIQANQSLSHEITNLEAAQTQLRRMLMTYTDSYPPVRLLRQQIETLETQTIPTLAQVSLEQLRNQEAEMARRIAGASEELKQIPQRTVREAELNREVEIRNRIYTDLQTRAAEARLAEVSALPEVSILDPAVAPLRPSSDTAQGIFLVAIAASVGLAILLAIVMDHFDKRFRYPEQATNELGLDIVGAIPTLTKPRNSAARLQEATQLVESFRSLSLTVRSAFDGIGPVQLTISSPGPGDGKSFVSANLASALADAGYRTALVDGDVRRGTLHSVFAPMQQAPGLIDLLSGDAALHDVLRPTSHANLFVVPCGKRRRHGPELLAGDGMNGLVKELRSQFDAIIVDSAPLGAGIDAYALGVATGAMLIVLRTGETDRKLAQAKLEVLDRMPVRILGTVLNDIGENPQFRYYYYLEGYGELEPGEEQALIGSGQSASSDD